MSCDAIEQKTCGDLCCAHPSQSTTKRIRFVYVFKHGFPWMVGWTEEMQEPRLPSLLYRSI